MNRALILFAKTPILGKVKTRLAASIGKEQALKIYQKLLMIHCDICSKVNANKIVFWTPKIDLNTMFFSTQYEHQLQTGNDLGERMHHAMEQSFSNGYDQVVLIGTDCPYLTEELLEKAFESLQTKDVTIGPAEDGGYYLIGMKKANAQLFSDVSWSSDLVLAQTVEKCILANLSVYQLPLLSDIDTEKDLRKWENI